jgi:phosphate-selective porin OprO and OprP
VLNKTHLGNFCGAILIGCAAALATPAMAANEAMLDLLKILRDKGSITAEEYELLVNTARADVEKVEGVAVETKQISKEVDDKIKDLPEITTMDKIAVESADGDFEWQLKGRVMADANFIDSDNTDWTTGTELRRARLGMEATLWKHWIGKLEVDFGGDEVSLKDAFIGYEDKTSYGKWWVKTGNQHIPFGFATMSSSNYMTFIARPAFADGPIQPARFLGAAFFTAGDRWTFHTGVYLGEPGEDPDECGSFGSECSEQISWAARVTAVPFMKDNTHLMHIGGGIWLRNTEDSSIDIDQRPVGTHVTDGKLWNADFEGSRVDGTVAFNAEGLIVWGPFHVLGEYSHMTIDQDGTDSIAASAGDYEIHGWYLDASWFLTGESKNYDAGKGQFGSLKPKGIVGKGGIGAWEIGIRYENFDMNDASVGIFGGDGDQLSFGLNWYVNNTMRLMADYVTLVEFDAPDGGVDIDGAGGVLDDEDASAFLLRGQIYW